MNALDLFDKNLLEQATAAGLHDTNPLGVEISAAAEREARALVRMNVINGNARRQPKQGTRDHGKAARPVAGSGQTRYATHRLHKPTRAELAAMKLAELTGKPYIPAPVAA